MCVNYSMNCLYNGTIILSSEIKLIAVVIFIFGAWGVTC